MELKQEDVFKQECYSAKEFMEKFHPNVIGASQSISYAVNNDKVDYIKVGVFTLIVMTKKTREYTPIKSNNRTGGKRSVMSV